MMTIERHARETAKVLGISEREALILEFLAAAAWADVVGNKKAQEANMAAARHAAGQISIEEFRTTLEGLGY